MKSFSLFSFPLFLSSILDLFPSFIFQNCPLVYRAVMESSVNERGRLLFVSRLRLRKRNTEYTGPTHKHTKDGTRVDVNVNVVDQRRRLVKKRFVFSFCDITFRWRKGEKENKGKKNQSRKLPECRWILIKMCCCPLVFLCSTVSKLVDYEHCVLVGFRRNSRAVTLFRGSCRSWRVQPAQPYHNDRSITEIFTRKLYLSFAFLLCFAPIFHLLSPLHCLFVSITMSSFVFDVAKGRGSEWNRWAKQLVADRFVYALLLSDPFLSFQILL